MNLIHFDPTLTTSWAAQVQRELERAFDLDRWGWADVRPNEQADWAPAVDVHETDTAYTLAMDVPGVAAQDLEITTDKGVLTIRGHRSTEVEEPNRYRRVERTSGKFVRRFTLPDTANADGITAKTALGVLTVTIPKREEVQPRRIEITAA